jgi:DNA-directed RNA polymerase subunit M/transcription elongation factor TFIIS
MRFCPVCAYYLFLQDEQDAGLHLLCRHCGYKEKMEPKTSDEALILETTFQPAAGQKQTISQLNEYTKLDPTLPHLKTIACPNQQCPSQADTSRRDILYIKTDVKNLKYQYSCTVCSTQWGS